MNWLKQTKETKGKLIGLLKIVIMQAGVYLTVMTAVMMAATFHHTTLVDWTAAWGFSIPFWLFMGIIITGGLIFLWFEWKFMVGGFYSAWNEQWWEGDNPLRVKVEKQEIETETIKADIKKIKEALNVKD